MSKIQIHNPKTQDALVVVSGKEHGKLYRIKDHELSIIEYIEEHPPEYSDNEGFFQTAGHGDEYQSGAPKEVDDKANFDRYVNSFVPEIHETLKKEEFSQVLVFEPEHLKGFIQERLPNTNDIPVHVIDYVNLVEAEPTEIAERLESFGPEPVDPADPASVAGEENAEEKRKILETAEMRHGSDE